MDDSIDISAEALPPQTSPEGSVRYHLPPLPLRPKTLRFPLGFGPKTAADPGHPEKQPGCVTRQT
jgi:hypothetical protein